MLFVNKLTSAKATNSDLAGKSTTVGAKFTFNPETRNLLTSGTASGRRMGSESAKARLAVRLKYM